MTTTETPNGTPPAVDWDALFSSATTEAAHTKKKVVPVFDGEIPEGLKALVRAALVNSGGPRGRIVLPLTDQALYDQTVTMARAALYEIDQNKQLYPAPRFDGEGDNATLKALTFTVGAKRGGRRPGKPTAPETSPEPTAEDRALAESLVPAENTESAESAENTETADTESAESAENTETADTVEAEPGPVTEPTVTAEPTDAAETAKPTRRRR
jgi:hypothetical protein